MSATRRAQQAATVAQALAVAVALAPAPRISVAADPDAGGEKAELCAACHGPGGNSANPAVPSLAGQPAQFIATQLFQFREGNRKDPQMTPVAAGLSNADMNALAAYFSRQKLAAPARAGDPARATAAARLTEQHHCVQCHGPALTGQQHIPRLPGQQREYLRAQLLAFKAGTRADMDGNMTSAAQALSAQDIEILADYLSSLDRP